jgi:hypothetical protein
MGLVRIDLAVPVPAAVLVAASATDFETPI